MEPPSLSSYGMAKIFSFEEDVSNQIIQYMSARSIIESSTVCKDWWEFIKGHPKRFRFLVRKVQIRKALAFPDFNLLKLSFEARNRMNDFANILRHFCENLEREKDLFPINLNLTNENYLRLVYGNVDRLKLLWANLPNHNPTFNLGNAAYPRNLRY